MKNSSSFYSQKSVVKVYEEEIASSPGNLQHAFANVAKRLGKSQATVVTNWYGVVRHHSKMFSTKGKNISLSNTKIVRTKNNYQSFPQEIVIRLVVERR